MGAKPANSHVPRPPELRLTPVYTAADGPESPRLAVRSSQSRIRHGRGRIPTIGVLVMGAPGSLGNDAILQAIISELRSRWERVSIRAFTANPTETTSRHGIPAYRFAPHSAPLFQPLIRAPLRPARKQNVRTRSGWLARLRKKLAWLLTEIGHARFLRGQLAQLDVLIVAGADALDGATEEGRDRAFMLYKWARLARLARTRLVIASAALGGGGSWLTRRMLKAALRRASYRSFRDACSQNSARLLSGTADQVVPDLALGRLRTQGRMFPQRGERLTVAMGPIQSSERGMNGAAPSVHVVYPAFVTWLLEQGHRVLLFATNPRDFRALLELQRRLRPNTLARYGSRLRVANGQDLESFLDELAGVDCVVASRLHGIIMAHGLGLPVLALAVDRAAVAHMSDLRQLHHCLELEGLVTADLTRAFSMLTGQLSETAAAVYAASELARRAVAAQYDRVLDVLMAVESPYYSRMSSNRHSAHLEMRRQAVGRSVTTT